MAQDKEATFEASEAMAQRLQPIVPKPLLSPPPRMPIGAMVSSALWRAAMRGQQGHLLPSPMSKRERDAMSYPMPPIWWATNDGQAPMMTRGWCMPESLHPNCEEYAQGRPIEGSSASPWASSQDVKPWFPLERDLISNLQVPRVIRPRPARPLRTTICIDCSNISGTTNSEVMVAMFEKTPREVQAELELPNALPTIVSGRNNIRVHLTNDAYKEMVGQPVCPWLDSLPCTGVSRRINGEVVLEVCMFKTTSQLPSIRDAFPCTARISWECDDAIASLTVPCAVEGLMGNSVDYCFIWRFDSSRASIMYCIV